MTAESSGAEGFLQSLYAAVRLDVVHAAQLQAVVGDNLDYLVRLNVTVEVAVAVELVERADTAVLSFLSQFLDLRLVRHKDLGVVTVEGLLPCLALMGHSRELFVFLVGLLLQLCNLRLQLLPSVFLMVACILML